MFVITRLVLAGVLVTLFMLIESFRKRILRKKAAVFIIVGLILAAWMFWALVVPESILIGFKDPYKAHKYMTIADDYDHEVAIHGKESTLVLAIKENAPGFTPSLLLKRADRWYITSPMRYSGGLILYENDIIIEQITNPQIEECYMVVSVYDIYGDSNVGILNNAMPDAMFTLEDDNGQTESHHYIYCFLKEIDTIDLNVGIRNVTLKKDGHLWRQQ